jgi:hypothetical protein
MAGATPSRQENRTTGEHLFSFLDPALSLASDGYFTAAPANAEIKTILLFSGSPVSKPRRSSLDLVLISR